MPKSPFGLLAVAASTLLLVACESVGLGSSKDYSGRLCPNVSVVRDLERKTVFVPGGGEDLTEVVHSLRLGGIRTLCEYDDDVTEVNIRFQVVGTRGPADQDRFARYEFFVAVLNKQGEVTAREVFTSDIPFADNRRNVGRFEDIVPKLPPESIKSGERSRIVIGLILSRVELDYNRRNPR